MSSTIRASVAQICTAAYDLELTLAKVERYAKIAKERDGSQLVVFPEATIGGQRLLLSASYSLFIPGLFLQATRSSSASAPPSACVCQRDATRKTVFLGTAAFWT